MMDSLMLRYSMYFFLLKIINFLLLFIIWRFSIFMVVDIVSAFAAVPRCRQLNETFYCGIAWEEDFASSKQVPFKPIEMLSGLFFLSKGICFYLHLPDRYYIWFNNSMLTSSIIVLCFIHCYLCCHGLFTKEVYSTKEFLAYLNWNLKSFIVNVI